MRRALLVIAALALGLSAVAVSAGEIHEAIMRGDVARVTELIRAHPDIVHERNTNPTLDAPLHTAATVGNVEIARLLLDAGAELEAGDRDNSTPLHDACVTRKAEMVAFLMERGADVNRRDYNGGYALSFAASGGDAEIVRRLLDAGATLYYRDRAGFSLLHFAASRGLTVFADTLLAIGEDVNARTASGLTPLMLAAMRAQTDMAAKLLAHGADPGLRDEHGQTALHGGVGSIDMVRLLLDWGAEVDAATGQGWNPTPLIYACAQGNEETARLLVGKGANVNHLADGHRPLEYAVANGFTGLVNVLLEAGASLDFAEPQLGCSPLHIAALRGYADIARALIDHGAQVGALNTAGETPLELAGRYGHAGVVGLLVERGARGHVPEAEPDVAAFANLPEKEAVVWFLGHSGWAVKTKNHLMVFDYDERNRQADEPGLGNGTIVPQRLANENVIVFASHAHGDHYDPRIWEWREAMPQVTYVLGFHPTEEVPSHEYIGARETRTIDGVKVTTIQSNDSGVGFWVEADGVTVFHAGDHANRNRDLSGPFKPEIDWLAEKGARPDLAFFPVSGCGFGDQEAVRLGVDYALETLRPRVFLPMHGGDLTQRYQQFIAQCAGRFPQTHLKAACVRGDRFHYAGGNAEALTGQWEDILAR